MTPAGRDLALVGGTVRTLADGGRVTEALLIEDGLVALSGTSREVTERARPGTPVVDLAGRCALPGLIDAHAHLELSALAERRWVDVRALAPADTVARVAAAAADLAAGEWIVAQGTFGQELPGRDELDRAAPGHPVVIRESMHKLAASSAALAAAGIDRRTVEPAGTRVRRTPAGEPTGLVEEGFDLFPVPVADTAWLQDAMPAQALASFVRYGVTTIHELPASAAAIAAWRRLAAADGLPCRVVLNPILAPGHQPTVGSVDEHGDLAAALARLHPWLSVGALKLFLDGAGEAAWTREQLAAGPGSWGLPPFSYAALRMVLAACRERGVQVWMHAVGGVAQELAVDAVEETNRTHPAPDHRSRIEHLGNAVCDPAILPRLAPAGVVPVPTASFMHRYRPRPGDGEPGGNLPFPFRALIDAGLAPPGNSDSAGTAPFATTPWHGVAAMVQRRTGAGTAVPPADQAVSLAEAVLAPTRHAAHATFAEGSLGMLAPGMAGDVAVYGADPLELAVADLPALEADLTIVAGRIVHRGPGAPATAGR
ncbi:MAG TPA: amidohydrolase family protein [Gaiellales bacterium]